MAREGYRWSEDRGRWESERDREMQDREHDRDRYRDRDRDSFNERSGSGRDDERGGRREYRGRDEGAWDEGQYSARSYGQGVYGQAPGTQGQQGRYGGQPGQPNRQDWGAFSRGNDLGSAADRYGNTGGDQYGGGGFRGGEGYGARNQPQRGQQYGQPYGQQYSDRFTAQRRAPDDMPQRGMDSNSAYESGMPSFGGGMGSWFGSGGGYADIGVNGGFGNSMGSGYGGGSNTAPGSAMASGRGWGDRNDMSGYSGSVGTPSMPWSHGVPSQSRSQQLNHAGRGPKGWKRPDDRIREDLSEQLERHPGIDASEIEVQVSQGEVTLTGTVSDRHAKRMAEDVAEHVSGVRDVQNQIRVQRDSANAPNQSIGAQAGRGQQGGTSGASANSSETETSPAGKPRNT